MVADRLRRVLRRDAADVDRRRTDRDHRHGDRNAIADLIDEVDGAQRIGARDGRDHRVVGVFDHRVGARRVLHREVRDLRAHDVEARRDIAHQHGARRQERIAAPRAVEPARGARPRVIRRDFDRRARVADIDAAIALGVPRAVHEVPDDVGVVDHRPLIGRVLPQRDRRRLVGDVVDLQHAAGDFVRRHRNGRGVIDPCIVREHARRRRVADRRARQRRRIQDAEMPVVDHRAVGEAVLDQQVVEVGRVGVRRVARQQVANQRRIGRVGREVKHRHASARAIAIETARALVDRQRVAVVEYRSTHSAEQHWRVGIDEAHDLEPARGLGADVAVGAVGLAVTPRRRRPRDERALHGRRRDRHVDERGARRAHQDRVLLAVRRDVAPDVVVGRVLVHCRQQLAIDALREKRRCGDQRDRSGA